MKTLTRATLAALVVAIALPFTALAGAAWSGTRQIRSATSATGTETKPTSATSGIDLSGLAAVDVYVEAIGTMTAGGKLAAFMRSPATGTWMPVVDGSLDLFMPSGVSTTAAFTGIVVSSDSGPGRIAWEPSGIGTTVTVTVVGSTRKR